MHEVVHLRNQFLLDGDEEVLVKHTTNGQIKICTIPPMPYNRMYHFSWLSGAVTLNNINFFITEMINSDFVLLQNSCKHCSVVKVSWGKMFQVQVQLNKQSVNSYKNMCAFLTPF